MKNILFLAFLFVCFLGISQTAGAQDWPELKTFHGVMSQTFHPMQEGDFQPIRERSGEMAAKAKAVAKSAIPEEYKSKEILVAVKQLAKDSKALDKLIKKNGTDEAIGKSLTALHDVFHRIMGLCNDHEEHEGN
ncbi:MAG: hypothetical protein H6563_13875 [Lewinellaceae bacterium]|nr:hypothetical protein [Lewinellaceae bacterium]